MKITADGYTLDQVEMGGALIGPPGVSRLTTEFGAVFMSAALTKQGAPLCALALLVPVQRFRYAQRAEEPRMIAAEEVGRCLIGLMESVREVYGPEAAALMVAELSAAEMDSNPVMALRVAQAVMDMEGLDDDAPSPPVN